MIYIQFVRSFTGDFLTIKRTCNKKYFNELFENFQLQESAGNYSDWKIDSNIDNLDKVLEYIHVNLNTFVYLNGKRYKTIQGAKKAILKELEIY